MKKQNKGKLQFIAILAIFLVGTFIGFISTTDSQENSQTQDITEINELYEKIDELETRVENLEQENTDWRRTTIEIINIFLSQGFEEISIIEEKIEEVTRRRGGSNGETQPSPTPPIIEEPVTPPAPPIPKHPMVPVNPIVPSPPTQEQPVKIDVPIHHMP